MQILLCLQLLICNGSGSSEYRYRFFYNGAHCRYHDCAFLFADSDGLTIILAFLTAAVGCIMILALLSADTVVSIMVWHP